MRDANDVFYARVEARAAVRRLSPAAAIFYDADLSDDEKYTRLTALLDAAPGDSAAVRDAQSHLASLDARRHGGIA